MRSIRITVGLFALLIAAMVLLGWRCWHLQCRKGGYYEAVSTRQQQGFIGQTPQRGVILDCRGRVLAASNEVQTIFAEPRVLKEPRDTATELAPILDMGAHEISRIINDSHNSGFARIAVAADPNQCFAADKIAGVGVQSDWERHYPMGPLAAHVVGFTSTDNQGLGGIEMQYQNQLIGSPGRNVFLADAFRRPIRLKEQTAIVKDGRGLILTMDATIQQFARSALAEQLEKYKAESGVVIAAQPRTGAILALVSLPDFDPCNYSKTDPNQFRNRAIVDSFEPGSLIKPVIVAIALDDGTISKTDKIFCENGSYSGRGFGTIGEYRRGFGELSIRDVLVQSSNIGMAKIGQKMGREKLYKGLTLFGFGRETGVDLPGEAPGLLWPADKWTGYSVTRIPFGQEISVTAIQLVKAFCILANGGHPVRPYVVRAMVDNDGSIIKMQPASGGPDVAYIISPEVAKWIVNEPLVGVIKEGTGTRAKSKKWQVFGKTGTANIAKPNERGYSERDYVASFIAGAPADDPAIVVLVSIRRPNVSLGRGYTGGAVAAPVASEILEKSLTYLETHPLPL